MSVQVALTLDEVVVECAGPVLGTLEWWGNDRGLPVGVVLQYATEGRGDRDSAVVARCILGSAERDRRRFSLDVPADGPVTYHGQLLRIGWQVAVHVPATKASPGRVTGPAAADVTVVPWGWSRRPAHGSR